MVRNKRLTDEEFFSERENVLSEWPTGKECDLDDAIAYHKSMPASKNWVKRVFDAKAKGQMLVEMVGMGQATFEMHTALIQYAEKEGHADLLGTSVDNYTRMHDFKGADRGIEESKKKGRTVLNGFPMVSYGVATGRKVVESVSVPMAMKFSALDPRIIAEIGLASGYTKAALDIHPFFLENANVPLETVIRDLQYVHRLEGYYEEHGCPVFEAPYMVNALLTPPSLEVAEVIVEDLVMAEQGVKNFLFCYPGQGNLIQDVASCKVIPKLFNEYMDKFGYKDVHMAIFFTNASYTRLPDDIARAYGVVCNHVFASVLSGATVCSVRAVTEGKYVADLNGLCNTFKAAKTVINMLKDQKIELDSKKANVEAEMFEKEVRSIVDAIIRLGDGDVVVGEVKAVESGVLDCPWGTHPAVARKIMGVRDAEGAVRWFAHGNMPFSKDIVEFHNEKVAERAKKDGKKVDYNTISDDVVAVGDGTLMLPAL